MSLVRPYNRPHLAKELEVAQRLSWAEDGSMHPCAQCGNVVEDRFRYCPWCSFPQRLKLVEFFAPHPEIPRDRQKGLRVSRYFRTDDTPAQVRFSIWSGKVAAAAVSLSDGEASRLADFVAPRRRAPRTFVDQVRESLRL
jgi:hypothetical protein